MGISEWMCYYANYNRPYSGLEAIGQRVDPQSVYDWAKKQYQVGVDAISLYQSETLARMNYLQETLTTVGDQQLVSQRAKTMPVPNFPADYPICWMGYPRTRPTQY